MNTIFGNTGLVAYVLILFLFSARCWGQGDIHADYGIDVLHFNGAIVRHNPDIAHLITNHPSGVIVSMNRKTYGLKTWERAYNYPDWGASYMYQHMGNAFLGEFHGLYAHYNFYFLRRKMMLRAGTGLAYNTTPYDADTNFRNIAYGTHILSSTYLLLNYKRERIFGGMGLEAGVGLVHYSNANFKAPNKSTNTLFFNVGVNYLFDSKKATAYVPIAEGINKYKERIGYNFIFRTGINESDVVGSGQFPFYTFGFSLDKRWSRKSKLVLGTELFISAALQEYINFRAIADFNDGTRGDEDATRVGVFLGHEVMVNRFSILTQMAYYAYYPYDFEGRFYNRFGLKYRVNKNLFTSITVRSHIAKAEMAEFTLGFRL